MQRDLHRLRRFINSLSNRFHAILVKDYMERRDLSRGFVEYYTKEREGALFLPQSESVSCGTTARDVFFLFFSSLRGKE